MLIKFFLKSKGTHCTHNNMDESQNNYAEWKNSDKIKEYKKKRVHTKDCIYINSRIKN